MRPVVFDNAPYFHGVRAELVERHGERQHRSRSDLDRDVVHGKAPGVPAFERLDGCANDVGQLCAGPVRLKQQVVGPAEGQQAAFDGEPAFFLAFRGPQAFAT